MFLILAQIRNPLYTNPEQKYHNVAYGLASPKRQAPPTSGQWETPAAAPISETTCYAEL